MNAPDQMETDRLLLRKIRFEDADWIFSRYATDPSVSRYLRWQPHRSISETHQFLEEALRGWKAGRAFTYIIEKRSSGEGVGTIDIRDQSSDLEIGYVLAQPFWGLGYATEAATAVIEWAKQQQDIHRIHAYCDPDNPASSRVLEKAGLTFVKILPHFGVHPNVSDEPRDIRLFEWHRA
ncbi:GNAT family N-acetyltransferase [bacterium]|nr:GNAT family N-acetyltransferase [bacterium]